MSHRSGEPARCKGVGEMQRRKPGFVEVAKPKRNLRDNTGRQEGSQSHPTAPSPEAPVPKMRPSPTDTHSQRSMVPTPGPSLSSAGVWAREMACYT